MQEGEEEEAERDTNKCVCVCVCFKLAWGKTDVEFSRPKPKTKLLNKVDITQQQWVKSNKTITFFIWGIFLIWSILII